MTLLKIVLISILVFITCVAWVAVIGLPRLRLYLLERKFRKIKDTTETFSSAVPFLQSLKEEHPDFDDKTKQSLDFLAEGLSRTSVHMATSYQNELLDLEHMRMFEPAAWWPQKYVAKLENLKREIRELIDVLRTRQTIAQKSSP